MARKKSKGSKKARARKARAKESAEVEAAASTSTAAELDAPVESSPPAATDPVDAGEAPGEDSTSSVTPKKAARKKPAKKSKGDPEATPPAAEVPEEARAEDPIFLDDGDDDPADLVAAVTARDDDIVTIAIDTDDDLDDAEARERLIAEALAFVAVEEGEALPADAPGANDMAPPDEQPDDDAVDPETASSDLGEDEAAASSIATANEEGARDGGDSAGPKMTAQALLALSEIHAEGLASLPEELILDLGEATTSEERDRLLSAALAHVEMQDAVYRVNTDTNQSRRIKAGIATGILLIAALVGVRPPGLLVPDPPASLTQADRTQGVRVALLLQAQQVEAFRVQAGRLPNSIAEVETSLPGIRLVKSSNRLYQLIAYTSEGEPIVYDSEVPAPEFERLRRTWSTTRDGS